MRVRTVTRELRRIVGDEAVRDGASELLAYSYDGTFQQAMPMAVAMVRATEQVSAILRLAGGEGIPVVARGTSTGLAGGSIPPHGASVVNLARMRAIREVDPADGVAVAEAGAITGDLHQAVERTGFFYPPDPASLRQCTIGGNLACNAGGPRCLKYGVTRDYVRGLVVVLADGTVVQAGGRTLKSSTGYALPHLFVGSEGTLGIITEATLRIIPLPRGRATALAFFRSLEDAANTVTSVLAEGLAPSTLELMDRLTLTLVDDVVQAGYPRDAEATLLIEADGPDAAAARNALEAMAEAARRTGATQVRVAASDADAEELWRARRSISAALGRVAHKKLGEDVVVPRSRIPEMVRAVGRIASEHGLQIPLFGHAGDGNLHPNILFDPDRDGELRRVQEAAIAIFEEATRLGGALSGEHGVGTLKRAFLERNLGVAAVDTMRAVKDALDPRGILNPGKLFPDRAETGWESFLEMLPTLSGSTPG
jgi:glycolate oxidase